MTDSYISIAELAKRWGLCYQTVWRMVRSGKIDSVRFGGCIRIPSSSLAVEPRPSSCGKDGADDV